MSLMYRYFRGPMTQHCIPIHLRLCAVYKIFINSQFIKKIIKETLKVMCSL